MIIILLFKWILTTKILWIRDPTYIIRDFCFFEKKMAEFPKIWLNNDLKTVPTDLESKYMSF